MMKAGHGNGENPAALLRRAMAIHAWTLPQVAAVVAFAMGLSGLAGWVFSVPALKSIVPGAVEMKANTAMGLILSAAALFILGNRSFPLQRLGQVLGLAVLALGMATGGEYLFGWQLGIDEFLFRDTANAYNAIRGRMSPYSAGTFAMIGLALAVLPWRSLRPLVILLSILVMGIGAVSFLGYLWNAAELVTDRLLPPVAVNTAVAFWLIGAGIFCASLAFRQWRLISAVEIRILASFMGAFVILVLMGGYAYKASVEFDNSVKWVRHTQETRIALGELYSAISDVESVQRIYMLTGNPAYKEEYKHLVDAIDVDMQDLARMLADNPTQVKNIRELGVLIAHRVEILSMHITVFEREGYAAVSAAVASDDGMQIMQAIRALMGQMNGIEVGLLSKRDASLAHDRAFMLVALLVTLAAAAGVFATLFLSARREMMARSLAEQQLRAGEENLSVTLNSIGDAVLATDADARVTRLNPVAEQLTGWTQAEAVGRPVGEIFNIINSMTREPAPIPVLAALEAGVTQALANHTVLIARGGSECAIADSCAPIRNRNGKVIGAVLVFRDVTEEYAAQAALQRAKEEADLANRAKDSFLATMSHEIRTPLSGLLGMLELLGLTALDADQRRKLVAAQDSGRGLLRILSDILDWSKIEAGKLELSPQVTSIAQVLGEVVNTYAHVASSKNLVLQQSMDPRLGKAHIVDPLRLSQILNNFVSNAVKFTHAGSVELRADRVGSQPGFETVRFSVRDTGIGLSEVQQASLFQQYAQGASDTARLYGGTGLGLAITRRLADMMDGVIGLESAPGEGSVFSLTLTLPTSDMEATKGVAGKEEPIQRIASGDAGAPRVLVVDDHPINLALLTNQVELLGLCAEGAEDGEAALELWKTGRFDIVITDCHMPKMDGYELTMIIRALEAQEGRARTPIIACTANALGGEDERCYIAGMEEILIKPASMQVLRETLLRWLPEKAEGGDSQAPTGPGSPIDLSSLGNTVRDATGQVALLGRFQLHQRKDLEKLLTELERDNLPGIVNCAHRMKGGSLMVGARELAGIYAAIEQAAKRSDLDAAHAEMPALMQALARFDKELALMAESKGELKS